MKNNAILLSGGLDATALLILSANRDKLSDKFVHVKSYLPDLKDSVGVFVDYCQVSSFQEYNAAWLWATRYGLKLEVVADTTIKRFNDGKGLLFGNGESPVLRNRNLTLGLLASAVGQNVYFGFSDETPEIMPLDCTPEFLKHLSLAMTLSYSGSARAPLLLMPKLEVMREAYRLEPQFFAKTMTCWTPINGEECRHCKHCVKKINLALELHK